MLEVKNENDISYGRNHKHLKQYTYTLQSLQQKQKINVEFLTNLGQ